MNAGVNVITEFYIQPVEIGMEEMFKVFPGVPQVRFKVEQHISIPVNQADLMLLGEPSLRENIRKAIVVIEQGSGLIDNLTPEIESIKRQSEAT